MTQSEPVRTSVPCILRRGERRLRGLGSCACQRSRPRTTGAAPSRWWRCRDLHRRADRITWSARVGRGVGSPCERADRPTLRFTRNRTSPTCVALIAVASSSSPLHIHAPPRPGLRPISSTGVDRDPRGRPARRDPRAGRRHARRAPDPRGRAADRLPARRPLPGAAARRRRQPPARVLPQGRLRDPARQGGAVAAIAATPAARSARTRARASRRSRGGPRERINAAHGAGVTLLDPGTTYVDAGVKIGAETTIPRYTMLEGET